MAFQSYADHDAVALARLVADGAVHPTELVEAAIERIEQTNPAINAVVATDFERARERAISGLADGPFRGVPILIKDLMTVAGERATFGSVFFRDYIADETSEVMERISRAGFIPIGRTNTPEFGLLPTTESILHGPARNPWDLRFSTGGSSGGAAAAVAVGMVPLAHGSDGGGSIRIPASACGVFGFKPSRGRIPRFPASPADFLAVDLGVSRSVRDSAAMLDVLHGAEPGAGYWAPPPVAPFLSAIDADPARLRIGYSVHDARGKRVHPDCEAGVMATVQLLADLGHDVNESAPSLDGQAMADAFVEVWAALAGSVFQLILDGAEERRIGRWLRRSLGDWRAMKVIARLDRRAAGRDSFEPFTWNLARLSKGRSPAHLEQARTQLQRTSHQMGEYFQTHDVLLTPVLGAPPVRIGRLDQTSEWDDLVEELTAYVAFTPLANFGGLPAMSVPMHWADDGLPIGSHFMGRFGEDFALLQLAGQLERARPWAGRRPAW